MSLTNPNSLVTEERLNQFYGQILPYLGGMPDVLANKFSKSDLYSTSEKLIGVWTDGKPLYQIVVELDSTSFPNNATKTIDTGVSGVDNVISLLGFAKDASGYVIPLPYASSDGKSLDLYANCSSNLTAYLRATKNYSGYSSGALIVQYTKTSDSAISIGSDTDYSTTEKIIGTWVDGKPLYQKTYTDINKNGSRSAWVDVADVTSLSIDTLVSIDDYGVYNGNMLGSLVALNCQQIGMNVSKTKIQIFNLTDFSAVLQTMTIRYTKTTD